MLILLSLNAFVLLSSAASGSNDKCIPRDYSLDRSSFPICSMFKHNTCCDPGSVLALYKSKAEELESIQSKRCRELTEARVCYQCDPRVGQGSINKVCQRFCDDWHASCIDEFYESSGVQGSKLSLCGQNSVLCSRLGDIYPSSTEFCQNSGLSIAYDSNQEPCFDGSAPTTKGILVNPSPSYGPKTGDDASISATWSNYIKFLLNNTPQSLHAHIRTADKIGKGYIKYIESLEKSYGLFFVRFGFLFLSLIIILFIYFIFKR